MSYEFKSAHDQAAKPVEGELVPSPKPLFGTWLNCDKETRGIVKIEIGPSKEGFNIHVYGACHPNPCDWKEALAHGYSDSVSSPDAVAFTAVYDFKFAETIVTGHLQDGCLILETYTNFKDGSKRYDYYSRACLCRCNQKG